MSEQHTAENQKLASPASSSSSNSSTIQACGCLAVIGLSLATFVVAASFLFRTIHREWQARMAIGWHVVSRHVVSRDINRVLRPDDLASETVVVLRTGKKKYALLRFE